MFSPQRSRGSVVSHPRPPAPEPVTQPILPEPITEPLDFDAGRNRLGYRWTICALLFMATTINYVDRQVLGILAPTLQRELRWTESQYGDIVSWFSFAYAIGFLF